MYDCRQSIGMCVRVRTIRMVNKLRKNIVQNGFNVCLKMFAKCYKSFAFEHDIY